MKRALWAWLLLATGCRVGADYSVHDTEGWEYRVTCQRDRCGTEVESPQSPSPRPRCEPPRHAAFVMAGRGVVAVCAACVGGASPTIDLASCRALRCTTSEDCAPRAGSEPVQCVHGLCQTQGARALDDVAAAALCLAGSGPTGAPRGAEVDARLRIARGACAPDGTCVTPAACRPR